MDRQLRHDLIVRAFSRITAEWEEEDWHSYCFDRMYDELNRMGDTWLRRLAGLESPEVADSE